MNMFERIKNVWANLKLPDYAGLDTPTGVESLKTSELLEKISKNRSADQVSLNRRLLAPWSQDFQHQFTDTEFKMYCPRAADLLRERIAGLPVIELACGEQGVLHNHIFCNTLAARSYRAVDRRTDLESAFCVEEGDILSFLESIPSSSSHVVAFGLFNEPLAIGNFFSPASDPQKASIGHLESEHLRRICREIYRILPAEGLFFGSGIYPLGSDDTSIKHLNWAGVVEDKQLAEEMQEYGVDIGPVYGMFFYSNNTKNL